MLIFLFLVGAVLFTTGNRMPRPKESIESGLAVAFSVPVQLFLAAGDRYLAANIATWRATMFDAANRSPELIVPLAKIQEGASWLNPAHEDNYYIAAAILPWEGQLESAQTILWRATEARKNDFLPPFFHGFNQIEFMGDSQGAYRSALVAAEHSTDPGDRQLLTVIAAKWLERGGDTVMTRDVVARMAELTKDRALQKYLQQRVARLEGLLLLQEATTRFTAKVGRSPERLEDLMREQVIESIPSDPTGFGFEMRDGVPAIRKSAARGK